MTDVLGGQITLIGSSPSPSPSPDSLEDALPHYSPLPSFIISEPCDPSRPSITRGIGAYYELHSDKVNIFTTSITVELQNHLKKYFFHRKTLQRTHLNRGRSDALGRVEQAKFGNDPGPSEANHRREGATQGLHLLQGRGRGQWLELGIPRWCSDRAQGVRIRGTRGEGHKNEEDQRGPAAIQSTLSTTHILHHRLTTTRGTTFAVFLLFHT